ncbi:MAG: helix-turn-helix transcriptional regulator [Gemmatimonadaceae bacterium]
MTGEDAQSFGDVVAAERKRRVWSLRELADRVPSEKGSPISPQYLNDIEHNRRVPAELVIEGLAKALGLTKDYLFHLAGKLPPDLAAKGSSPAVIEQAYKAFRKNLRKS